MRQAVAVIGVLNLALFVLVGLVAVRQWRQDPRHRAGLWAAGAFGALAFVVSLGRIIPEKPDHLLEHAAQRLDIAVLVLFPYLLHRFTSAFQPPARRLERSLGWLTIVVLAATFVLPYYPAGDAVRPLWFLAYIALFLVHWSVLLILVAVRLWRAGRDQPNVARRRMRTLAFATTALTAALFLAAAAPGPDSLAGLVVGLLATTSALSFLAGLAPPEPLRLIWRRSEQDRLRRVTGELMGATTEADVLLRMLEPAARIVGAQAAAIYGADGQLLGAHGVIDRERSTATVMFGPRRLVVQTTPFTPYFGNEEYKLLQAIASLTGLALDRARLFSQEREARQALEQADELKTQFVALAAHELRSPVTAIVGFTETLHHRGAQLSAGQREQMERLHYEQVRRLGALVDQLLDLSRLEASAVEIRPQRVTIADQLQEIVEAAAPGEHIRVQVEGEPGAEAMVDVDALDRIVSNLVVNAFRHGRPPISVLAGNTSGGLRVTVEDRGAGVPSDLVPQLFERFSRGRDAADRSQGSGLGLAIARSYARAHRGELEYRPALPHGAAFEVMLPAVV